jgi:excisionase family DNA binding protein
MSQAMTAKELFDDLQALPATERGQFFLLLGSQAFQDDNFTHDQVFGHLATETLTVKEAAEYLEMSVPNFRRYVRDGHLIPVQTVGRNQMFSARQLKAFKRSRTTAAPAIRSADHR